MRVSAGALWRGQMDTSCAVVSRELEHDLWMKTGRRVFLRQCKTNELRNGWVKRPFCHVLIKATRWDSPPWRSGSVPLDKLLIQWRLESRLSQEDAATRLSVSLRTY